MDLTPALTTWDLVLRLGAATLAGCLIGLNRDLKHKPAGMRTHALVSMGAAGFTLVGLAVAWNGHEMDRRAATQVVQGIITGIGFLGAGVFCRVSAGKQVHGLTTAATICLSAAFGIISGAAYWPAAGLLVACTLIILVLGLPIENAAVRWWTRVEAEGKSDGKSG